MFQLIETKKITEAAFAFCDACGGTQLGAAFGTRDSISTIINPFWSLAKSIGLHESGCGHRRNRDIIMYRLGSQEIS